MKKELAIVLGATGNITFGLANVLMGLKKNNIKIPHEIIVFEQNISARDKKLLNQIIPISFIEYKYPTTGEIHSKSTCDRFTQMTFSRYECLTLLNEYKKVLWLDVDLLIKGNLTPLVADFNSQIGLWQTKQPLRINFTKNIDDYNMESCFYNAGVIIFNDTLTNYKDIREWCYKKTNELSEYLYCGDQGIINILLEEFNLNILNIDEKYNCHPRSKKSSTASILHPYCAEKFWNFYNNKEWNQNYQEWIKIGGTPYSGSKVGIFERFIKTKYPEVPNPLKYPRNFINYFKTQKYKDFDF
ncbi:MAG: hypothetical protein A2X64_07620 [Ignavibacteria bacterium GWF2_33_9]|nr:MAG: hypothetical protein A2X64_07620 [Ignavibacteria bacterium GWF2_33_9]